MVYVYDNSDGLVKIIKRGNKYCIYRLKEIQVKLLHWVPHQEKHKYVFEKQKVSCYGYKPYDDKDVSNDPDVFYDDVKRKNYHKINKVV